MTERLHNQLVFADLTDYPVMAQALDNQWLPADLAASRQRASTPAGPSSEAVAAGAAELRRSLVNSGTLVVNRAYFLNNEALYSNYLPTAEPSERAAFIQLLNRRAMVPYLYTEREATAEFGWGHDRSVATAWRRLVTDESDPGLVRFDWDDASNRQRATQVGNFFSTQLSVLRRLPAEVLAQNLGIPKERARAMRVGILKDLYDWAGDQDIDRDITRNMVYERFLSRPGTEPHENLLREGEHIVPAKQLIDLLYSLGVPKASGLIALTPPDSPPRATLNELREDSRPAADDPEAIGLLLRDLFADELHRAVDGPNSYAGLSLADIVRLRREEEWRAYIDSLEAFVCGGFRDGRLPSPEEFAQHTSDVTRSHARMLRAARRTSASHRGFVREISTVLVLESAGIAAQLSAGQDITLLSGSLQLLTAAAGVVSLRLQFRDTGRGWMSGGLGHSVTLPSLRLNNLRKDWQTILRVYGREVVESGGGALGRPADQMAAA
ncbi:hypothetical protein ACFW7J_06935 [Streptomyces sp. NPDC059525]|uniref:hypothetical protein n=1 Tax=Streptomyces sp. NPDC059525 TaxID=3346857 RepID=UPI0036930122